MRTALFLVGFAALLAAIVLRPSREDAPVPAARAAAPAIGNLAAYIPPQCYAKTTGGRNPCATCHRDSRAPNFVDDADVQTELSIPRYATENRWTNALVPPSPAAIGERELLSYVRQVNYDHETDCAFAPDDDGWDRDPRGEVTWWRAYASAPTPGMFWPTNGSAGDAFIRLPDAFRRDREGRPSLAVYAINLAILEAAIRRTDVSIAPTDERALGADLDGDGTLGTATRIAFVWPPAADRAPRYVGEAAALDPKVAGWPAAGLFPAGTEIVHSLRYLDVIDGKVWPAARMKEVRYMRKARWRSYADLDIAAKQEQGEKERDPDVLRHILGDAQRGLGAGGGWVMRGWIEDARGALRPQTVEETAYCIGCHGGVGATTDGTFGFARKVGWYSWGARGFRGIGEPVRDDGRGEYRVWLEAVRGGDDFGTNTEVAARFLDERGKVPDGLAEAFAKDIAVLVVPTPERALALNRGYLAIVRAQSFAQGRDVLLAAPQIEARLVQGAPTGIQTPQR